jgi:extradiol dioxygenase family protein
MNTQQLSPFHLALPVTDLEAADCDFLISPKVRCKGNVGEQATMFFSDPAGNAREFKSFADPAQLFAS